MVLRINSYWIGGVLEGLHTVETERGFADGEFEEAAQWACDITYNDSERVILRITDEATGQTEQF